MAHYGDHTAEFAQLEPSPTSYRELFGRDPSFEMHEPGVDQQYVAGLTFEPSTEIGGAVTYSTDVFALAGSSGAWAVWGQRDWEIALLWTRDHAGPWEHVGVSFFSPFKPFDDLRGRPGWTMPLSESDLAAFHRNVRACLSESSDH